MLDYVARACLEPKAKDSVAQFAIDRRNPDGGFRGRGGEAGDLYYTVFGAAILNALGRKASLLKTRGYVASFGDGPDLDFVHLTCLARLRAGAYRFSRPRTILDRIEEYRADDGGYHHAEQQADRGSAYAAFLALMAYEDFSKHIPDPDRILTSMNELRTDNGAYKNEPDAVFGGTNATAAAVLVRSQLGDTVESDVGEWLLAQRHEQGGFLANPRAPVPDLLSTATALFALRTMNVPTDGFWEPCTEFVESMWHEDGGFGGHLADDTPDCEYTFYALLALGCLT
jgi:prenyltransferase beta subunit